MPPRLTEARNAVRLSRRGSVLSCRDTLQRLTPRGDWRTGHLRWGRYVDRFEEICQKVIVQQHGRGGPRVPSRMGPRSR